MNEILKADAIQIIQENDGLGQIYNSKFLITGATGMIGMSFVNTLIVLNEMYDANISIYILVRNKSKLPKYVLNNAAVHIIEQDVVSPIVCDEKIDYIVHAASPASPLIMKEKPVETNFANTIGTANVLNFAKSSNSKGVLFISSREIYGQPSEGQEYFYENGPYGFVDHLVPRNAYAEGKKAAENMCACFRQENGLNAKIVRLAHTYGPGMSINDGRVQADFLKNVVNGENITLNSKGEAVRTYTYISDAISGMFKVLLSSNDFVYNIADEDSKTSIRELAETIATIYPERGLKVIFDIPQDSGNSGFSPFTLGILSTDKIREELKWKPKYSIFNGFKRTIDYLESELINKDDMSLAKKPRD